MRLPPSAGSLVLGLSRTAQSLPTALASPRTSQLRRRISTLPSGTLRSDTLPPSTLHSNIVSAPALACSNPWDYVVSLASHQGFNAVGFTGAGLLRLIRRLQKIHRGNISDGWEGVLAWLDQMPCADLASVSQQPAAAAVARPSSAHLDLLPASTRAGRELVLAYIHVFQVKGEVARGRHSGSAKRPANCRTGGDPRATQVALISKAYNDFCPGLLLNLLLDWNTGATLVSPLFLDRICARFLASPAQARESFAASRRIFDVISNNTASAGPGLRTTGFVDDIWNSSNPDAAKNTLAGLLQDGVGLVEDALLHPVVSSLAIQLMQCASRASQLQSGRQIFAQYQSLLSKSTVAYNILLYPEANSFNMPAVIRVLQNMRRNGAYPDAVTWTTIMSGMCRNGRIESAMKLFAMHLDFLPTARPSALPAHCNMLYAPKSGLHAAASNLWQQWYANNSKTYVIDSFITNWLRQLSIQYHGSQQSKRRDRGSLHCPTPWLPSLTTHKLLLKHLGDLHREREMTEHFALLKRYWPQYKQWTTNSGKPHGCDDGLQGIERLVRGHMTLRLPELRDVYGLSPNQSLGDSPFYYDYCDRILKLAERERLAVSGRMPERLLFNKSLHAFALAGDLRSIIYHMEQHRMLCDIATWTEVVRCICVQILGQPLNSRMICPQSAKYSTWVEFILSLEPLLAARGIRFSQVTFGQMIQTATLLYDAGAILRIVSWMIQRTTVRFNAGMLKMVLGLDVPFDLKCSLVKSTLGGKLLGIDRPTVRPDNKLLALVVRLAKRSEDLDHLPDIVALFHDGYGVSMLLSDYDYLIALCKQLNLHAELKYWMHCKAIAHVN